MARVTFEDCLNNVDNRFQLVLVATKRARQISNGAEAFIDEENDKPTVVALREIAEGLVTRDILDETIEDEILGSTPLIEQIMLSGDDGKSLTAIVVLSPNELVNAGFLDKATGSSLQKDNEKMNDPQTSEEDCAASSKVLNGAADNLRNDESLKKTLMTDIRAATKDFRKWEQVGNVFITLEPFAMCNGQLTQSYKVKRDAVSSRYAEEL